MRILSANDVAAALDYPSLIERLAEAFRGGATVPARHRHAIPEHGATLLLMPAWDDRFLGVKTVAVFPENAGRGLATVQASYLLMDGASGVPLASIDGHELTLRRTAAVSALAARFLARPDARRMLMVGTGAMAPHLVRAHCAVRPIAEVAIWGRAPAKAEALAARLAAELSPRSVTVCAAGDLAAAAAAADLISCATLARAPLVRGAWLALGAHLDLVGGFTPEMREADDDAVKRGRIFVDTCEGALAEAGDLVDPLRRGAIAESAVVGDLAALCRGAAAGRCSPKEITIFKSVGSARADLAAAVLAFERAPGV